MAKEGERNEHLGAVRYFLEKLPGDLGFIGNLRWNRFSDSMMGLKTFSAYRVAPEFVEALEDVFKKCGIAEGKIFPVPHGKPLIRTYREQQNEDIAPISDLLDVTIVVNKSELEALRHKAKWLFPDTVTDVRDGKIHGNISGRDTTIRIFETGREEVGSGSAVGRLEERRTKGSDGRDGPS